MCYFSRPSCHNPCIRSEQYATPQQLLAGGCWFTVAVVVMVLLTAAEAVLVEYGSTRHRNGLWE